MANRSSSTADILYGVTCGGRTLNSFDFSNGKDRRSSNFLSARFRLHSFSGRSLKTYVSPINDDLILQIAKLGLPVWQQGDFVCIAPDQVKLLLDFGFVQNEAWT